MTSSLIFRALAILFGVAIIGLAVASLYENHLGNQCTETFDQLSDSNQARLRDLQARIDKVRTRQANLQARSNELIKSINTPDAGAGTKKD
jgi:hypothetical protein